MGILDPRASATITRDSLNAAARTLGKRGVTSGYTLTAPDALDIVLNSTSAFPVTVTVPTDATVALPNETVIPWRQIGAGQIAFAAASGVTIISRGSVFLSAGQYAEGTLTKVDTNTWILSGDITSTVINPTSAFAAPTSTSVAPSFMLLGDLAQANASGVVTAWTDKVSGLTMSVPSGKTAPTFDTTSFPGGGVKFTKSALAGLYWPKPLTGSGMTVIILARVPDGTAHMWWAGSTSDAEPTGAPILYNSASSLMTTRLNGGAAASTAAITLNSTTKHVHRGSFSSDASARIVKSVADGGTISASSATAGTAVTSTGLGLGGVGSDYSDITVGGLWVFDSELSETEAHNWTAAAGAFGGVTIGAN